jgi:hypothetical protein
MIEADYSQTEMAMNSTSNAGDDTLAVVFNYEPAKQQAESELAGRPIFKEVPYISIKVPGSKSETFRPVRAVDKTRFPRHWAAFMARESQEAIGTPLSEWPQVTRSIVKEMTYLGITTVEQLANVSDSNSQNIMGIHALKKKATDFLARAEKEAAGVLLESKLAERDEQIAALLARVEAMEAGETAKPKRKRRSKAEMLADKGPHPQPIED